LFGGLHEFAIPFCSVLVGFLHVLKCRKTISIVMVISNRHWRFPRKNQLRSYIN